MYFVVMIFFLEINTTEHADSRISCIFIGCGYQPPNLPMGRGLACDRPSPGVGGSGQGICSCRKVLAREPVFVGLTVVSKVTKPVFIHKRDPPRVVGLFPPRQL